jgi:hypothetical protein
MVAAHEAEHLSNDRANAKAEGRRVVDQSMRLFTSLCSECGRVYVSGGQAKTVTAADEGFAGDDDPVLQLLGAGSNDDGGN